MLDDDDDPVANDNNDVAEVAAVAPPLEGEDLAEGEAARTRMMVGVALFPRLSEPSLMMFWGHSESSPTNRSINTVVVRVGHNSGNRIRTSSDSSSISLSQHRFILVALSLC